MKNSKYIIVLFLALFKTNLKAQTSDLWPKTNSTLDKFSNTTWVWTNGTDTLKIYLKKMTITLPNIPTFEQLIGFHYYKKGSVVIENSYTNRTTDLNNDKRTILLGNENGSKGNNLEGTLRHTSKNKTIKLTFIVDNAGTKATMIVKNTEGTKIEPYDSSISLPNNITLTKVANDPTPRFTKDPRRL